MHNLPGPIQKKIPRQGYVGLMSVACKRSSKTSLVGSKLIVVSSRLWCASPIGVSCLLEAHQSPLESPASVPVPVRVRVPVRVPAHVPVP
eukprot:692983-Pelagomonas_calceolata.AAC.1